MKQEPKVAKRRHSQRFTMAPREILRRKLLVEILPASKAVLKSMTLDAERIPVAFLAAASAALKTVGFAGRVKREEGSVCIFHRPARANVCLPPSPLLRQQIVVVMVVSAASVPSRLDTVKGKSLAGWELCGFWTYCRVCGSSWQWRVG